MDKILGYILDIVIAILIIFASVTIYFGLRLESVIKTLGVTVAENFMEDVKRKGYFTQDDYEALMEQLALTNVIYDISFEHRHKIYEPEYRFRTLQEIIDAQNAAYTGTNIYHYKEVVTEKPVVSDPVSAGSLNTETNESIMAAAVDTPASSNHVHSDACYIGHRHTDSCKVDPYYGNDSAIDIYTRVYDEPDYVNGTKDHYIYIYHDSNDDQIGSMDYFESIYDDNILNGQMSGSCSSIRINQYYLKTDGTIGCKSKVVKKILEVYSYRGEGWTKISDTCYRKYNPEFNIWLHYFGSNELYVYSYGTDYYRANLDSLHAMGWNDKYSCPYCLKNGLLSKTLFNEYICGKEQDDTLDCNQIITSITPTNPVQTVALNDPLITTVVAAYLDGSSKTVIANADFSTASLCKNQQVKLTYSYTIDGVAFSKTCDISVTVNPRTKTCKNNHIYNLNSDGTDPGCPYCREWVKTLSFINPVSTGMTITIGTTLQDNGFVLLVTYFDGHTEILTSGYIDNLDTTYLGTKSVMIGYKGETIQLTVTTVCAKMKCDICGNYYDLYPDGTNPGCPYCISKTPVFTGNVLNYYESEYTDKILDNLYHDGIYKFNQNDTFVIKVKNKSKNIARNIMQKVLPSLTDQWFTLKISKKISTN